MGTQMGDGSGRDMDEEQREYPGRNQRQYREWIDAADRPGGIGRSERQRMFWERVASGGRSGPNRARAGIDRESDAESESPWESAQLAVVTLLTVMVFGMGWVALELEGAIGIGAATGYDVVARNPSDASALRGSEFSQGPETATETGY